MKLLLFLFAVAAGFGLPAATINVYISAPGVTSTFVDLAKTETFDKFDLGIYNEPKDSAIGVYDVGKNSSFAILDPDQYGGAEKSQYMSFGAQSNSSGEVSLNLFEKANYFGFWWSAGDELNGVSLYQDNVFLARISTEVILKLLSSPEGFVTAVDNSRQYKSNQYFGNLRSGENTGEPYAYIHLLYTGEFFNRIVFDNSNSTGTGFESDNHSVYFGDFKVDGASVFVQSVATGSFISPAADPGEVTGQASFGLAGAALVSFGLWQRKRR